MVGASHPHVGKVRAQAENTGDVETITTSIDTKGRKQPAKRKSARSQLGKMLRADRAEYLDQQGERGGTAKSFRGYVRKKYVPDGDTTPPGRNDIASSGEIGRLRARNEECRAGEPPPRTRDMALRSEIEELKTRLADIPDFLDRSREVAS